MKKYKQDFGLKQIWPVLLWHKCEKCKDRFRRERGWSCYKGGNSTWYYVCAECCPTPEDAREVFYGSQEPKQMVELTYCPDCLGKMEFNASKCLRDGCNFIMPKGKAALPNDYGHLY
jgi:hypothetical protein